MTTTNRQSLDELAKEVDDEQSAILADFQTIAGLSAVRRIITFTALRTRADQHQQKLKIHLADAGSGVVHRFLVTVESDDGHPACGDQAPTIAGALCSVRW